MTDSIVIPNKNLFKMNEVCSITGVKPYVLRFWETEFEEINPSVSSSGQKLFSQADIESIILIKKLLFEDKKTIDAAKAELMLNYSSLREENEVINEELPPALPEEEFEAEMNEELTLESDEQHSVIQELQSYDIEKLVMAKEKLNHMLSSISDLKNRHNWS